jgi:hypothetical protein
MRRDDISVIIVSKARETSVTGRNPADSDRIFQNTSHHYDLVIKVLGWWGGMVGNGGGASALTARITSRHLGNRVKELFTCVIWTSCKIFVTGYSFIRAGRKL